MKKSKRDDFFLEPRGEKDFFSFYSVKNNREVIDRLILCNTLRYSSVVDPDDMKIQILMRLQRSNPLKRYNPARARLNTFLTVLITGYAARIASAQLKKDDYRDSQCQRMTLLYPQQDLRSPEEEYTAQEIIEIVRGKLKGRYLETFNLMTEDMSTEEMSLLLKVSRPTMIRLATIVKERAKAIRERLG